MDEAEVTMHLICSGSGNSLILCVWLDRSEVLLL